MDGPAAVARNPSGDESSIHRALAWVLLLGFTFIVAIAQGAYASHGVEPSGGFQVVANYGLLAFLWFWLKTQIERYRPRLMFDMGLIMLFFWFVVVPYYMWRYQRWGGLAKVGILCLAYAAAWVFSAVVAAILS